VTTGIIGIIVPDVPVGPQDVIVTNSCGTGKDVASAAFSVVVAPSSPELIYSLTSRVGDFPPDPAATRFYVTAVDTAAQTPVGNPQIPPAMRGEAISISAIGLGDTNPHEPIGDLPVDMAPIVGQAVVTLGANPLPPEAVTFVGLVPGALPGVYRIDITLPVDAPLGDQPVTIQVGDAVSPAALLTIGDPTAVHTIVTGLAQNEEG